VGLVLGLAAFGASRNDASESEGARPRQVRDIQALYLKDCGVCHGSDGRGTEQGPSLVGSGAASVDYQVSTGRMPLRSPDAESVRRTPKYRPATIRALVAYVQSITGGSGPRSQDVHPRAGNAARGGELFRGQCAACHSWSGEGGALTDREAPRTQAATAMQIAEAVRTGPGNMPRFGEAAIADDQLDSLVAYTRYLDHPRDRGGEPLWHLGPLAEGAAAGILGLGVLLIACRWIGTRT
jgi:ubiquinol-cytochrome c reductase cytochrome c subunit